MSTRATRSSPCCDPVVTSRSSSVGRDAAVRHDRRRSRRAAAGSRASGRTAARPASRLASSSAAICAELVPGKRLRRRIPGRERDDVAARGAARRPSGGSPTPSSARRRARGTGRIGHARRISGMSQSERRSPALNNDTSGSATGRRPARPAPGTRRRCRAAARRRAAAAARRARRAARTRSARGPRSPGSTRPWRSTTTISTTPKTAGDFAQVAPDERQRQPHALRTLTSSIATTICVIR